MTNLTEKAMLVRISIHLWTGRKFDREASREVIEINNATSDAGRFNKLLLPKAALRGTQSAATALRSHHATNTLPWTIDGVGLLPATNYFAYTGEHRRLAILLDNERDALLANYDTAKAQAKSDLGDLYREEDYPEPDALRAAISSELEMWPLPDAADFRVTLGDAEEARIRDEIAASVNAAVEGAVRSLWQRVHEAVSDMHARLEKYRRDPETQKITGAFRDSIVSNMRELVDLLPRLNVCDDPALESMRQRLADKLCAVEPDELREDEGLRKRQADECRAILGMLEGYTGTVQMAAE